MTAIAHRSRPERETARTLRRLTLVEPRRLLDEINAMPDVELRRLALLLLAGYRTRGLDRVEVERRV